jgi:hypothetical protein
MPLAAGRLGGRTSLFILFSPHATLDAVMYTCLQTPMLYWRGIFLFNVFAPSETLESGQSANDASHPGRPPLRDVLAELREMAQPARREFLTLSVRK